MFDKVNGISSDYDGTKYLVLFGLEKNDAIYGRIRYLIGLKCGVTYVFSYNFEKITIKSDDRLPLEETLTLHSVIILIRSVFNKDQYHYYCNIFVQKYSYQLPKNNDKTFFDSIIMLGFLETKVVKEEFYRAKESNKKLGFSC